MTRLRIAPRTAAGVGLIVVLLLVAGLAALAGALTDRTTRFRASHVDVRVTVMRDGPRRVVGARFVPDAAGIHLYGPDLPANGIDGAGRPTRVAIVSGGWAAAAGSIVDVAPTPFPTVLPGFSGPFSVLPDGPVTLRVPIEPVAGDRNTVRVALTFMACTSDGRCYPPVVDHELDVVVP